MQIVEAIKEILETEGVKRIELAEMLDVSRQRISDMLNRETMHVDTAVKVLDALGYDLVIESREGDTKITVED